MTHKEIYAELRKRALDEAQAQVSSDAKSTLKLFTCQVIYTDMSSKNTWFTVLDVSKDAAHETCQNRVKKFNIKSARGHISTIRVTEIEGPFNAGQILHEER